ncbi:MAG: galactitol-1-phosphate 5-dehydrogenase [Nanoarchaeota archaeon]
MNAALLTSIGTINYSMIDEPTIADDDVLVKVHCAGICGSDIPRVMKTGGHISPLIPGHEFAGTVAKTGKRVIDVRVGDRVSVFPLISCGTCAHCAQGNVNLCDSYDYLGSRSHGGFAEHVRCPARNTVLLPDNVSFEEGAQIEPLAVALRGVRKADDIQGKTMFIFGMGPIGLYAAQIANQFGAHVIAVDRNEYKLSIARDLGIKHTIDNTETGALNAYLKSQRLTPEIVMDCSGSTHLLTKAIDICQKGGRIILVGNVTEDLTLTKQQVSQILRKELTIRGSWNSIHSSDDKGEWNEVIKLLDEKKVKVQPIITHKEHLKDVTRVFNELSEKTYPFVKVMLYP